MTAPTNVQLCEPASKLDQAWRDLYFAAFPVVEQEPEAKLQGLIDAGRMLYHRTVGKQGELLCFSLVSLAPDFSFLAYIATDPKQRSGGYGSKHMRALIDTIKKDYPQHKGLFFEIESTNPQLIRISDEEKTTRQRRLSFYRRLGARRLCRGMQYLIPDRNGNGEYELDLLYFNFAENALTQKEKLAVVSEIYQRFYGLAQDDATVLKVLGKFGGCSTNRCEDDDLENVAPESSGVKSAALAEAVELPAKTAAPTTGLKT